MTPLHGYRVTAESGLPEEEPRGIPNYGCCIYLGPRGQRCERPALEDGFCARHSPDAAAPGPWTWFRRSAAILVAAAILWPIIEALLEELSHWRR
jgi:hypothetical protein